MIKRRSIAPLTALAIAAAAWAAEPLCWERTPNRPAPAQFDTFHGDSLDFRGTFTGFGAPPFLESGALAPRLYYQTNGMGAAWWSIPAAVSYTVVTNCQPTSNQPTNQHANYQLSATFTPDLDPGAERLAVFFGAPSNAYAAAQVRFRNSPGAFPNNLDPPSVLDWQAELAAATNALWESSAAAFMPQSNAYTKSETDARIAELAPPGMTTNDVCAIVTNEVEGTFGGWTWTSPGYVFANSRDDLPGNDDGNKYFTLEEDFGYQPGADEWSAYFRFWEWDPNPGSPYENDWGPLGVTMIAHGTEDATSLTFSDMYAPDTVTATRTYTPGRNALGLARLTDIAPTVSNTVTKAFVENLGIKSGIQEESDPVWVGDKPNYATKQSVTVVSNIAASADTKANTLISYVNGDDVMDVVTNYDSVVHISSRSLRQRVEDGGTNVWRVVWDEMTRWDWFMYTYMPANYYTKTEIDAALDEKADRAWGFYDSHTGGWSPDGYTQISSPKILIAAGMAYQRHVVTGGAVWVLESNGLATEIGGVASNGFFRISDDDGNSLFEIVKGNKRTIGSTANALTTEVIMGITHMHISYNVESAEHPTIEATANLGTPFVGEDSASSIVNVTWTGSSGAWVAEVWPKTASSSLFVRASHEVGGETYIKNTAPTGLDGGLIYNGVKYRVVPYSSDGKTYLTLEAW